MATFCDFGVLLLQLGTPDAPTTPALRRYLREFLSDRRVIDLSPAIWRPILELRVLPTRPARSAALYRKVWTTGGSPLLTTSLAQAGLLSDTLSNRVPGTVPVEVGMRYGRPSIADAVDRLIASNVREIVALPMYPQYASATTGSSLEQLFRVLLPKRVIPAVRVVPPYFDHPAYIDALAAIARDAGLSSATTDRLILSFHGLPARYAREGDPYPDHCEATADRLTAALGWPADRVTLSYQSRFGREVWLQPYTDVEIAAAARRGERVAVMCPGFTADCLETIEEIGMTGREQFEAAGGHDYQVTPCLNTHATWVDAMATLVAG